MHEYLKSHSNDPNRNPWIGSHYTDQVGEFQTNFYQSNLK